MKRNLIASGALIVVTSILLKTKSRNKDSRYASCAFDKSSIDSVQTQVFNSDACIGTYPANDPCEDRNVFITNSGFQIAAVFDGHGGWTVSEYASKNLVPNLLLKLKNTALIDNDLDDSRMDKETIQSFNDIEQNYINSVRDMYQQGNGSVASVGSCVCLAIRIGNRLTIANCGDCRAVLGSDISQSETVNSKILPRFVASRLSRDHNARIPLEVINLQVYIYMHKYVPIFIYIYIYI
jgi:serine/threonine protein phosphatase PrpC